MAYDHRREEPNALPDLGDIIDPPIHDCVDRFEQVLDLALEPFPLGSLLGFEPAFYTLDRRQATLSHGVPMLSCVQYSRFVCHRDSSPGGWMKLHTEGNRRAVRPVAQR